MKKIIQFARTYAGAFGYWLMICVALWLTLGSPSYWPPLVILIVALFILVFSLIDQGRRIQHVYCKLSQSGIEGLGEAVGFCGFPRPGTSMMDQLQRRAGVYPSSIKAIYLQTCGLKNTYLNDFADYIDSLESSESIHLTLIGSGDVCVQSPLHEAFSDVKVLPSKELLIEHFNLIETDSGLFAWYEPKHVECDKYYIPEEGAMLMRVDDKTKAFEHYYSKSAA